MRLVLLGDQRPTFSTVPEYTSTLGGGAAELAARHFDALLDWQRDALDAIMAIDQRKAFRFADFALSVPRQNGKSALIRARCLYGLAVLGERILYTCQNGDTADEMFGFFADAFEDEGAPDLHSRLRRVRRVNGKQAVELANGGAIRFSTRTDRLARGRGYDVLVYDEAQYLTEEQFAASKPTVAAARRSTQSLYLGTPQTPGSAGGVFRDFHDRAHSGDPTAPPWMEWGVDEIGDVTDRARWARCNPSLGYLIDERAVEGELSMRAATFARERLGWWEPHAVGDRAIDAAAWAACATDEPATEGVMGVGVKFAPDGCRVCVAACRHRSDAPDYVELLFDEDARRGTAWLVTWLAARSGRVAGLLIDGASGAADLVQRLAARRFPPRAILRTSPKTMADACSALVAAVNDGEVLHWSDKGQAALDESAAQAVRRALATSYGFAGESTPLEAAALALWAARTTKFDPTRKGGAA